MQEPLITAMGARHKPFMVMMETRKPTIPMECLLKPSAVMTATLQHIIQMDSVRNILINTSNRPIKRANQ